MTPDQLTGLTESHLVHCQMPNQLLLIHREVENNLRQLIAAAAKAGFELRVASGFRSFHRQQHIWNNKFSGATVMRDSQNQPLDSLSLTESERLFAILRWSALPGASRHHWGSDFDVYAHNLLPEESQIQLEPWEYNSGHQAQFYDWLREYLHDHGFFFPYAKDRGGVAVEPWHISHQTIGAAALEELSVDRLGAVLSQQSLLGKQLILENLETICQQYVYNVN